MSRSMRIAALLAPLRRRRPRRITVREAWLHHERFAGQIVALSGVVRAFEADTPTAYFTLDDGPHRIGLHADGALLRPLTDREVRASGELTFRPGVGIFLEILIVAAEG